MRLAPFRESRVPFAADVQGGLGALFVSLPPLQAGLFLWSVFRCSRRGPNTLSPDW
jgi:hypothetical protein